MDFSTAVKTVFRKYAEFGGRATRSEYWWWYLFQMITFLPPYLIGIIVIAAGSTASSSSAMIGANVFGGFFFVLVILWELAIIVPTIAVMVRRIRDAGFSPYLTFLMLIPYVGGLVIFVFTLMPSKDVPGNSYAPVPPPMSGVRTASEVTPSTSFCTSCGTALKVGAYCPECGAPTARP